MTTKFETEIVKTKKFNKIFTIVYGILYLIAIYYIFLLDKEHQNSYLKYTAFAIFIVSIYVMTEKSLIKPKKIGKLTISTDSIEFNVNDKHTAIPITELKNIYLRYLDYGSWQTHSFFGNKNYCRIIDQSGKNYDFEILIRNKESKNNLKYILHCTEFDEKFVLSQSGKSKTVF